MRCMYCSSHYYTYNAAGQRLAKVEGGTTTRFVYDGAKVVLERDGDDETQVRYTHEGGSLDGLASVKQIVDSSEAIENSYAYEAFGQPTVGQSDVANPYLFVGGYGVRWLNIPPSLYCQTDSFYDPSTGITINSGRYNRAWLHFFGPMLPHPIEFAWCMGAALDARDRANLTHLAHSACWQPEQQRARYENAYRHCLWMCELSRAEGESCALAAAIVHEEQNAIEALACGFDPVCWAKYRYDTLHDLSNNLVGVDCRNQGGTCWDCCNTAYYEFRLRSDQVSGACF
jgi:hypothetical protein